MKLVEIRTYRLKPGTADRFIAAFELALPLVRASGMDIVAFGRSDHEHESFYLIRAYDDRGQLETQQAAFYSSDAWLNGPREPLVACLDDYLNTLLWLSEESVEDLRARNGLGKAQVVFVSTITCPECGTKASERMPADACIYFYECTGCAQLLQPRAGDCCVFCSFGDVKCPPIQMSRDCCAASHIQHGRG